LQKQAAPYIQREERPRERFERYGKCCNSRGGGLELHKMTAKKNGPLTIYSLYESSVHNAHSQVQQAPLPFTTLFSIQSSLHNLQKRKVRSETEAKN
jgi:hypothetical protein